MTEKIFRSKNSLNMGKCDRDKIYNFRCYVICNFINPGRAKHAARSRTKHLHLIRQIAAAKQHC